MASCHWPNLFLGVKPVETGSPSFGRAQPAVNGWPVTQERRRVNAPFCTLEACIRPQSGLVILQNLEAPGNSSVTEVSFFPGPCLHEIHQKSACGPPSRGWSRSRCREGPHTPEDSMVDLNSENMLLTRGYKSRRVLLREETFLDEFWEITCSRAISAWRPRFARCNRTLSVEAVPRPRHY